MKNNFFLIFITISLVFVGPLWAFSIDQFHANIAFKYGVQKSQLTVQRVIQPKYIDKLDQLSEQTRQELVEFATTLDFNSFSYRHNQDYWRLIDNDRVLSYTFAIDIIKADRKTFDYYCWTVLSKKGDKGFTMGCAAFEVE